MPSWTTWRGSGQAGLCAGAPDTLRYRAGKFAARHRLAVVASAIVVVALVGGLLAYVRQAQRTRREAARAATRLSRRDLLRSRSSILVETASPPRDAGSRGARIDDAFRTQPDIRRELFSRLGLIYRDLAAYPRADSLLRKAIAIADNLRRATSRRSARSLRASLANVHIDRGQYVAAESSSSLNRCPAAPR
ncbi:MAG: hypothetical protein U0163_05035 [Gemmatimonadaceae bacterium]